MATGEVIREYLIALGYDPDEESFKKFGDHIKRAGKVVDSLGKAMAEVVVSVAAGVEEMSKKLEDFYFVSQRSNVAVSNLMAMRYAAKQVGIGADTITGAIESMSMSLRTNPGKEGLLKQLGIQTRDLNTGKLRDTSDLLNDLVERLKHMDFAVGAQVGSLFGIDPSTLIMLEKNLKDVTAAEDEYKAKAAEAGIDLQELSDKSHNFQKHLRTLESDLEIFGMLMEKRFIGPLDWLITHADEAVQALNKLDKATHGITTWLAPALAVPLAWKAFVRTARFAVPGLATKVFGPASAGIGSRLIGGGLGLATRFGGPAATFATVMNGGGLNEGEQGILDNLYGDRVAANTNSRTQHVIDYFTAHGWTRNQAIGIAANIMRESGFRANAVGDSGYAYGLGQWHPNRQAVFKKQFGKDITSATADEQLEFFNWELNNTYKHAGNKLRATSTPGDAAEVVTRNFEIPRDPFGASALSRQNAAHIVNITQNNTVTVSGVNDPHKAAAAVGTEMDHHNSVLFRNTRSAVQ